jgi:hypothetical protein
MSFLFDYLHDMREVLGCQEKAVTGKAVVLYAAIKVEDCEFRGC